jgi:hypothetical protein
MPELYVLEELKAYLISQGVAQAQDATPSLTIPSLWLNPRDGAPAPRRAASGGDYLEAATVTLIDTNTSGPVGMEAWIEETFVDVVVRSRTAAPGKLIQRQVRGKLAPIGDLYGRKHWTMGALLVEYSTLWRGDQPVDADDVSYRRVQSFRFGVRRSVLST